MKWRILGGAIGTGLVIAACSSGGSGGVQPGTGGGPNVGGSGGVPADGSTGGSIGTDGGDAGGATASCSGLEIVTSGNLDLDAKSIHVSGTVTLNGAPFPSLFDGRGWLTFENKDSGDQLEIDLGAEGPATYAIRIPPGRYDIGFDGNTASCDTPGSPVPCNEGVVLADVKLEGDGALDVNVPAVVVQGTVGVNGQSMPDAFEDRGALEFRREDGGVVSTQSFGMTGFASYSVTLLAGTYTVHWDGNTTLCDLGVVSPVPCNDGPVLEAVALTSDGSLDVNVPSVQIQGTVGINGQSMPAASGDRGALEFEIESGSSISTPSLLSSGGAAYKLTLLAGKYSVHWDGNPSLCESGMTSPVPCNDGEVLKEVSLTTDGALDVNVPTVQVQGTVGINGQAMPPALGDRGSLGFEIETGNTLSTASFGSSGGAAYKLTLLAGKYSVHWDGNPSLCYGGAESPVPCNDGPVLKDVALTTDGALDVNVPSVRIQGSVGINGQSMPSAESDRGELDFELDEGSSISPAPFGSSGPAIYAITLLAGKYTVGWDGNSSLCETGIVSPIPCNDGPVLKDVALTSDGALDVNVPAVTVQGTMTLDGKPLPDAFTNRGYVEFRLVEGGILDSLAFENVGPASYQLTLLAGRYVISHDSSSELCAPGNPLGVPCLGQVLAGCP